MTAYTVFMKHAEKVTKSATASRPILKGVCHDVDGSVVATDSHRLYKLENGFKTDEKTVIEPKTGATIDGNYPDVSRLLPGDEYAKATLTIDVDKTLAAVKSLFAAHKKINEPKSHITLAFGYDSDAHAYLRVDEREYSKSHNCDVRFYGSYRLTTDTIRNEFETVHVQAQFLQDALTLFKDAGEPSATIRLYGAMRPLTIKNSDVTALISPVRTTYGGN